MSYCRWENTGKDMQDCINSLHGEDDIQLWYRSLDEHEQAGVRAVMSKAQQLLEALSDI